MKCPNCGEIIKEKKKMNFCGYCGANLKTGEKTFTSPEPRENISVNTNPERISDFTPPPAAPAHNGTLDFGSPFERMVKENALKEAQANPEFGSPFERMAQESALNQEIGGGQTTVAPPPFNSFQPADFTMSKPGEAPEKKIVTVEPPIIPDTPSAFSVPPVPVTPVVPPVPEKPVTEQPAAPKNASPIASFDPSSLSMFDPYKMNNANNAASGTAYAPLEADPLDAKPVSVSSFNERLSLLIEQTSQPYGVDPEPKKEADAPENKQPDTADEKKSQGLDPTINISRNVTMRNASDDPNASPITYMEYTKSTDRKNDENKFSAYDFTVPELKPVSPPENTQAEDDLREKQRKEEAKKALDESIDSILDFTAHKKTAAEPVPEKPVQPAVEEMKNIPAAPAPEAVKQPEPEPVKPAEPEPEPEPVKEKLINYVGQEKKAAVQMIKFKGLIPEIEYVDSDKDFGFVVTQSIPADTEVLPGTAVKLSVSAGTWSDWEENPMPVSPNNFIIETKTEYRKRNRTRTTDKRDTTDSSEYEGYTLTGTDQKFSEWELDKYYTAEAIPPGPTCEIVRVASGFKYAGWFNPANMNGMSFSSPDVANFFNTNLSGVQWMYEEVISEQNIKPDVKNWKLITDNMNTTPAGDPMISNIFFSAHVLDGKSYAMKFGSAETEWYIYKRRTLLETIYHFEKEIVSDWGEWSEWAEAPLNGSEDCQVESRTLTRSRRKIPNN